MSKPTQITRTKLTCKELFLGFFWAGIMGFGGVLPIIRRMIVDQRRWMSQVEFNELFSLCQSLPGANVVNLSFALGARENGFRGAASAVLGLMIVPVMIALALTMLYAKFGALAPVRHALLGLAATAAGLALGSSLRMALPTFSSSRALFLGAGVYALAFGLHVPLWLIVLLTLPLSFFLAWRASL